ncbi:hypothetical protein Lal_00030887 [Lupinus albus]|uniref:Uncharacterized protein n=1 Tax=Lupinus albus TaxID=3870 RepID=A0A6A5LYL3_LUPAL|nr:hypothetical protein Lalb_Chr17g0342721 [Lupinus albus]KAF1863782.1 hypothetical protein Lal_00030887 [Lupinus albus]
MMHILNVSTTPFNFFCYPKILHPKLPSYPYKPTFRFHRNTFPHYLSTSSTAKFQTLAHFGRPTNRRNSLRKKLLHDHNQVRPNQVEIQNPSSIVDNVVEKVEMEEKTKPKLLGESVLLNKLENWLEQYKKDIEYWGIGSGPIFTVYQDSFGDVQRVLVDEEEILRRSRVLREVIDDFPEVSNKILYAKNMAREMENGNNVIARNSSVANFLVQGEEGKGDFVKGIRGFVVQPGFLPKVKGVGSKVFFVLVVLWAVKKLFSFGDKEVEHTEKEKEMMRRKIKARKEKEMLVKGAVEVIPEVSESLVTDMKKPNLDKEQLMNNIIKAKASADKLVVQDSSAKGANRPMDMDFKVQEIRKMAREARKIEGRDRSHVSSDSEMDNSVIEESSNEMQVIKMNGERNKSLSNHQNEVERKTKDCNSTLQTTSVDVIKDIPSSTLLKVNPADECNLHSSNVIVPGDKEINKQDIEFTESSVHLKDREHNHPPETPISGSSLNGSSVNNKPRIIRSVKEARHYLSKKRDKQDLDIESKIEPVNENIADLRSSSEIDFNDQKCQNLEMNAVLSRNGASNGISDSKPTINACEDPHQKDKEFSPAKNVYVRDSAVETGLGDLQKSDTTLDHEVNGISADTRLSVKTESCLEKNSHEIEPISKQRRSDALNGISDSKPSINPHEDSNQKDKEFLPTKDEYFKDSGAEPGVEDLQKFEATLDHEVNGVCSMETKLSGKTENWLEKNFHEVEPIIKQMRAGFRNNYMAAKERVDQPLDIPAEMESGFDEDGGELDWMQDDHLTDIVFRVRENELSGRDPFDLINAEDKDTFFRGLEKKVEKENKKLSHIHEWLHSNIENLDYGADGISIYDPPEKIIPRWKGPPAEKIPEFLNEFLEQRKTISTRNTNPVKKDENGFVEKPTVSSSQEKVDGSIAPMKKVKNPKTVIEGSDGSVKAGKKSGKEYWQHTKKWSEGFLQCYNAETDPEVKSTMKDIGKDLDRWITEKEIEEAADLMKKLPDKNKSFVEKKLNKVKREMELFGPQAVVSKYREYADDKEEDYLWWLDLPHILCIELYTIEDGEQRVGFYSLEMATDLELEPKPYHVIAFQDAGDCKNLCYIIQAHMEMLGNGNAFVVARPPKDAFREAKANGFGVTVIKKGELQLNIDQTLEEVEEQVTEIGSKIYHDMIMKERSVDINSIMKGVFGFNENTTKRLKRKKMKKPRKPKKA